MLRILRDKFIRLERDEDGVAFVTTLAVFMFIYLVCMGVYAIGTAVKTRIHLQNACDPAAYSAAVVEADTLSRIATINRAMSWTYAEMTHKEMDYIVLRWMKHAVRHWNQDRLSAKDWNRNSTASTPPGLHRHNIEGAIKNLSGVGDVGAGWFIGATFESFATGPHVSAGGFLPGNPAMLARFGHMNQIKLGADICKYVRADDAPPWEEALEVAIERVEADIEGKFRNRHRMTKDDIRRLRRISDLGDWDQFSVDELEWMKEHMDDGIVVDPPNAEGLLKFSILQDRINIGGMNICIRELAGGLPGRIDNTVREVLKANLPLANSSDDKSGGLGNGCRYTVVRSSDPRPGQPEAYFRDLDNNEQDERRFLRFADLPPFSTSGIDRWYVRKDVGHENGLSRHCQKGSGPKAEWWWWGDWWVCSIDSHVRSGGSHPGPCRHYWDRGSKDYCWLTRNYTYDEGADFMGNLTTPFEQSARLLPRGSAGYVLAYQVVSRAGDACMYNSCYVGQTARPLVLKRDYFGKNGTITVGVARHGQNPWTSILGTPIKGLFSAFNPYTEWVWAFSSAKAGYKFLSDTDDSRAYRIDWWSEIQSWNLCQSDWDAVHIPVRRAECAAESGVWKNGRMDFLPDYLAALWRWLWNSVPYETWEEMYAGGDGLDVDEFYGERDVGGDYRFGNGSRFWGNAGLPKNQISGRVDAKWQIGSPNGQLGWRRLQREMFH